MKIRVLFGGQLFSGTSSVISFIHLYIIQPYTEFEFDTDIESEDE